jgi:hypothetical protein
MNPFHQKNEIYFILINVNKFDINDFIWLIILFNINFKILAFNIYDLLGKIIIID